MCVYLGINSFFPLGNKLSARHIYTVWNIIDFAKFRKQFRSKYHAINIPYITHYTLQYNDIIFNTIDFLYVCMHACYTDKRFDDRYDRVRASCPTGAIIPGISAISFFFFFFWRKNKNEHADYAHYIFITQYNARVIYCDKLYEFKDLSWIHYTYPSDTILLQYTINIKVRIIIVYTK